jgi:hypothetical protein
MKRTILTLLACLLASGAYAQAQPKAVPTPRPTPTATPSPKPTPVPQTKAPLRVISKAVNDCGGGQCVIECVANKEVMVTAVCNNHMPAGWVGGLPVGPELAPTYLAHNKAQCQANTADSMYAVCARTDMINAIPAP